jgi:hypothetical protein
MDVRADPDLRRRDPASVMEAIAAAGIVAVLRAGDAGRFERVAEVLVEAGVTCVEFTLTSRGASRPCAGSRPACLRASLSAPAPCSSPERPTRPSTLARATLSRRRSAWT